VSSDEIRCRCGRTTYLVPGYESTRTCSKCGYLTSYCRCPNEVAGQKKAGVKLPSISERTRAMAGAAVISVIGTLFAITFFSSPFLAVFGLGMPFGLTVAFFAQWLKEGRPIEVAVTPELAWTTLQRSEVNRR
jgi:ribosomal protein L37E